MARCVFKSFAHVSLVDENNRCKGSDGPGGILWVLDIFNSKICWVEKVFNLGGGGGGCLDLSKNVLGVKISRQFEDCCSSTLQYRARMRSCSSRIPDKEKLNSNGTINKQPQTFNFLCFFLVILFNPLWGFLRLGNWAREFWRLIFGPEILFWLWFSPRFDHSRHLNCGAASPLPPPPSLLAWAIILWCGYSITSTFNVIWWKPQESVPFFLEVIMTVLKRIFIR